MSKKRGGGKRKTQSFLGIILLVIIALGIFNYLRPLPLIRPTTSLNLSALKASPISWPSASEAAVGAAGYGLLASNGGQSPKPTASVAKLITAMAVLSKYPLQVGQTGPLITFTSDDVAIYQHYLAEDGSVVEVQAGEQLSEYQALEAMMLPSANNIADSLAIWAFGSLTSYATFANQFVMTLGLNHTHIGSDASGFLPDTTSNASDLVTLGLDVLNNPALLAITGLKTAVLPIAGLIKNVDWLLGSDGIIGLKTGNSDQAGGVYLFVAVDNLDASHKLDIVGAIQGTPTLQDALNATIPLLSSVEQNFSLQTVATAGQAVGQYISPWGSKASAVATTNLTAIVWHGVVPKLSLSLASIRPPKTINTQIGTAQVVSGKQSSSVSLRLSQAITKPSVGWRILRHNI